NFSFGSKEAQPTEETAVQDRINSVRNYYEAHGMRRVVDAVMLVHVDRHPHVLLIQIGQRFFRLPGGYLKPGEDEREGLGNRLNELLGHPAGPDGKAAENFDWNVGECISTWWRPNFDVHTVSNNTYRVKCGSSEVRGSGLGVPIKWQSADTRGVHRLRIIKPNY
ncbi:hypothetical protein IWQ60_012440, partial [Tieghemiomyces parasiticus]